MIHVICPRKKTFREKNLFTIFLLFETGTDVNEIGFANILYKKLNLNFISSFEFCNEDPVLSPCTGA
jgi:hypothetical protein